MRSRRSAAAAQTASPQKPITCPDGYPGLFAGEVEAVAEVAAVVRLSEPRRLGAGHLLLHVSPLRLSVLVEVGGDDPLRHRSRVVARPRGALGMIPNGRSAPERSSSPHGRTTKERQEQEEWG